MRRRIRDLTPYRESSAVKDSALYYGAQQEIRKRDREIRRLKNLLYAHGIDYSPPNEERTPQWLRR